MEVYGSDFATLDFDFESEDLVPCIFCDELFNLIEDEQPLLHHLLSCHKLVIGTVEEISDLRHYMLYWKKLRYVDLKDFCVVFNTNSEPGAKVPSETYYLLCNKLPEDNEIRTTLNKMKLRYVIDQKEKERKDVTFSRQCIYCSEIVSGGVANCFGHLTFKHGFSVGNPDNIVFGARLLDMLEQRLKKLQCLYCEKTFTTHVVLRMHMRKKQHRCLNPKNKTYDKFYLLNYLKPGTPWEQAKLDHTAESDLDSFNGDEKFRNYGDALWTDWHEDLPPTTCLFCEFTTSQVPGGLFNHMAAYHKFDFQSVTKGFTFYNQVKAVNFIRHCVTQYQCLWCSEKFTSHDLLMQHMVENDHCKLPAVSVWDHSKYLYPIHENDGLLYHLQDTELCTEPISADGKTIVPEDLLHFDDSVLGDAKLRAEINGTSDDEDAVAMCLFCHYTASGEYPHRQIFNHMRLLHCFDFTEVVNDQPFYNQVKLINYIRWKTAKSECYICEEVFESRVLIEEHRALAGHSALPELHLFEDSRWLQPVLVGDVLLQKLRESGDSDDENSGNPESSAVDNVFSEDICVPSSILSDERLRRELMENMASNVFHLQSGSL